jgi:hypothetical protein
MILVAQQVGEVCRGQSKSAAGIGPAAEQFYQKIGARVGFQLQTSPFKP